MLAYFRGASIVLFGSVYYRQLAYDLLGLFASRVFPLLLLVALIGGGLGIANEIIKVMIFTRPNSDISIFNKNMLK